MIPNRDLPDGGHNHDLGMAHDRMRLPAAPLTRRQAIGLLAGATGAGVLLPATAAYAAATTKTPSETNGPYPADGTNGPDVLDESGIVRRDIRKSFGSATGKATGAALVIALKVVHAATSKPYPRVAIYAWHCDRLGRYSMYSSGVTNQNYLRGVQVADASGELSFLSFFPACYSGRWPHIHLEVYPTVANAKAGTKKLLTTQIAMPKAACKKVYARSDYTGSAHNLSQTSLATDNVFKDGWAQELATVTGSASAGYKAALTIAI